MVSGFDSPARAQLRLENEFAAVGVEIDHSGQGPRLRILDLRNGRSVLLDPLELASLTWCSHDDLGVFLDPSRTGWRSEGDGA